ncbi:MAG TPA: ABC transporter ATP-binding protein [Planctomycetota bacterium]|nr:ABC transporter ATP-binding protein [Planctomycetota bacterium]
MSSILEASGVNKAYLDGSMRVFALRNLNLAVEESETLAITGESGAGKSTLLHVLGLLDVPTSGAIMYRGRDVLGLSSSEVAEIRNRHFGFVFQFFHLLPDLSALENVMLPEMVASRYFGWRRAEAEGRAKQALDIVGLAQRMHHRPSQLSGGEKQRVAIARALVRKPDVIFCDEPTGNLDSKTSREIHDLIFELNRTSRQTFVIVTHDLALAARADRTVKMRDGSINEITSREPGNSPKSKTAGRATQRS